MTKDRCIFCGATLEPWQTNNPDFHTDRLDKPLRDILLNGACCQECNLRIVIPVRAYFMERSRNEKGGAAGEKL